MRAWLKPEIMLAFFLTVLAVIHIVGKTETVDSEERENAVERRARRVAKSVGSHSKSECRSMPSLSQWPSAKVVSVNREWGFVVLKPGPLTVVQGDVAYFEGVPQREV
jgi:hypothetical protein